MVRREVVVVEDTAAMAEEAAARIAASACEAVDLRGRFSLVLSGGSTPGLLYRLLASDPYAARIPWSGVHLFWGDERNVPPDDAGSNYRLAQETLISQVPIPTENVHRLPGELEPQAAALAYESALTDFFCGPRPRFDFVLLGLGGDGHTASLFPGSPALEEMDRLTMPVEASYQDRPAHRVTLTLPAINSARDILFLVAGEGKAGIVAAVLLGKSAALPAQRVRPMTGQVTWLLEVGAAAGLDSGS
jgi:6-phosphogluconolactonase